MFSIADKNQIWEVECQMEFMLYERFLVNVTNITHSDADMYVFAYVQQPAEWLELEHRDLIQIETMLRRQC